MLTTTREEDGKNRRSSGRINLAGHRWKMTIGRCHWAALAAFPLTDGRAYRRTTTSARLRSYRRSYRRRAGRFQGSFLSLRTSYYLARQEIDGPPRGETAALDNWIFPSS